MSSPASSTAVCVTGELRSATCRLRSAGPASPTAVETIAAFLRRELPNHETFLVLDRPTEVATHAAASAVAAALRPVASAFDDSSTARAAWAATVRGTACLTPAAVAQARKLQQCLAMVEAREAAGARYTHVMRLRPDILVPARFNLSAYRIDLGAASAVDAAAPASAALPTYWGPSTGGEGVQTPDTCVTARRDAAASGGGSPTCHARCTRVLHSAQRAQLAHAPPDLLTASRRGPHVPTPRGAAQRARAPRQRPPRRGAARLGPPARRARLARLATGEAFCRPRCLRSRATCTRRLT